MVGVDKTSGVRRATGGEPANGADLDILPLTAETWPALAELFR
jgi:hypothetical protein